MKGYRAQILRKVRVSGVAELVRIATLLELEQTAGGSVRLGLFGPGEPGTDRRRASRAAGEIQVATGPVRLEARRAWEPVGHR